MKTKVTDEEFIVIVKESCSIRQILKKLKLVAAGGNYYIIKRRINKLNIDISHFTGKGWKKGKKSGFKNNIKYYLTKNSNYSSHKLRKRLIEENIKAHKCELCYLIQWLNNPIPLELHHIDGDHSNNELSNLQLLCPNCHTFTDNYRGKGKGRNERSCTDT